MQKAVFSLVLLWAIPGFILLPLVAEQSHVERLIEIELETDLLQNQLKALESQVHTDYHQEMVEELSSQQNMRSYEWSTFTQRLENAEAFEENARREEQIIKAIKARLHVLSQQLHTLLPNTP